MQAESTILFHIYEAALADHESIKDYINFLKNVTKFPEFVLHPFQLTTLLCISTTPFYEEKVFDIIRMCISRSIQEEHKKVEFCWFKEMVPSVVGVNAILNKIIEIRKVFIYYVNILFFASFYS